MTDTRHNHSSALWAKTSLFDLQYDFIITELFAACALVANLFAYRQKSVTHYRIYSGIAMLLLALHFARLEAYAAAVGCSLAVLRNIVSLKYNNWGVTAWFVLLNLLCLGFEWLYLNHGAEIFVAYTASIIFTVGTLRLQNILQIRKWFTLAEALNLIYAVVVGSVFGSIYSALNLCVLITFWISLARKKADEQHSA